MIRSGTRFLSSFSSASLRGTTLISETSTNHATSELRMRPPTISTKTSDTASAMS